MEAEGSPQAGEEGREQSRTPSQILGSTARFRTLGLISLLVLLAVSSTVAGFAVLNRRSAVASLTEQQDAFVRFAVGTVEIGLSSLRIDAVRGFLGELAENPLFEGAALYDASGRALLGVPDPFAVPPEVLGALVAGEILSVGPVTYQMARLEEEDGTQLGSLVLAMSHGPIEERAHEALVMMLFASAALLLPTFAIIAWLLTWMERRLRSQADRLREAEREIEILAERRRSQEERARLEEMLRQSQKMETVGTLAGGIAHDFNNLLTPILGYVEMLADDMAGNERATDDLEQVRICATRAKDLVGQILAFGRRQKQEFQPQRLAPIIDEVHALVRATAPANVSLEVRHDDSCPSVLADTGQIHQVLMNLCTNAVHAINRTQGVVRVSTERRTVSERLARAHAGVTSGEFVQIIVADTGEGMDPETLGKIFEPFYTTKDVGEGTGLGLSVVHGIVAAHGGFITVESTPGVGTEFAVHLPLSDAPEVRAEEDAASSTPSTSKARILVVDDEEIVLSLIVRVLERSGHSALGLPTPGAARSAFFAAPESWDLVITDQAMPEITGLELAREFSSARPDLPILLATGYSPDLSPDGLRAAGVTTLVPKPMAIPEFQALVTAALEGDVFEREVVTTG